MGLDVRVKFPNKVGVKIKALVDIMGFGSVPELVRQATRDFVFKNKDLIKEE